MVGNEAPIVGGSTALHIVATLTHENPELLELLLRAKALTSQRDVNGQSALHCAVEHGHVMLISKLIAFDADVNALNSAGQSPLHIACRQAVSVRSVKILLKAGADMTTDIFRRTPCHIAYIAQGELNDNLTAFLAQGIIKRLFNRYKAQRNKEYGQIVIYYNHAEHGMCSNIIQCIRNAGIDTEQMVYFIDVSAFPNRLKDPMLVDYLVKQNRDVVETTVDEVEGKEEEVKDKVKDKVKEEVKEEEEEVKEEEIKEVQEVQEVQEAKEVPEERNEERNEAERKAEGKEENAQEEEQQKPTNNKLHRPIIFLNNLCVGDFTNLHRLGQKKNQIKSLIQKHCNERYAKINAPQPPYQSSFAIKPNVGQILIFTKPDCEYCKKVKQLFNSKAVYYEEIDISLCPGRLKDMNGTRVPEVWFNDKVIGGCDQCMELEKASLLKNKIFTCLKNKKGINAPKPTRKSGERYTTREIRRGGGETPHEKANSHRMNQNLLEMRHIKNVGQIRAKIKNVEDIINVCIDAGCNLDEKKDYQGNLPFDDDEIENWLDNVQDDLLSSSELPTGVNDEIWKDSRTQISVERKWSQRTRKQAMIQLAIWIVFLICALLSAQNHCALDNSVAFIVRQSIQARINGKPYDFSEQPNKRYLDSGTICCLFLMTWQVY
jgi:glutaredoxin